MSTRQDIELTPSLGAAATPAIKSAPAAATTIASATGLPKTTDVPKPVEAALKVVATMNPSTPEKGSAAPAQATAAARTAETAHRSRAPRFALLAASIIFAAGFGAIAGALGMTLIERPAAITAQLEAIDLTLVQGTMANLRAELSAIKTSVESSNRNVNTQLAKFTERLENRASTPIRPSAQAPGRTSGDVTGTVRPQALATPSAPRPRVIEGWALRRVSRGVAIIQSREGSIEVASGDVVPGIGRIESIRRLDGRWVVLTHAGMITSQPPR
jgi:hypothetical protein